MDSQPTKYKRVLSLHPLDYAVPDIVSVAGSTAGFLTLLATLRKSVEKIPGSGGSYRYLQQIYGPGKLGRLIAFLFIWQLSFSAPLSIASGSIGLANYASYLWPRLEHTFLARDLKLSTGNSATDRTV